MSRYVGEWRAGERPGYAGVRLGKEKKEDHWEGWMPRVIWKLKMGVVGQMNGKTRCAAAHPLSPRHPDSAILEGCESFH